MFKHRKNKIFFKIKKKLPHFEVYGESKNKY